ncbi:MAG: ATP-dependent zinc metalloprotease FtsH, partial [Verrucomicrobia bacterium]|nr:ATP-dependent zinc metalloprotease FtsH [Verrucomicrobiota bacterium]
MRSKPNLTLLYILILAVGLFLLQSYLLNISSREVPYSEFKTAVVSGKVARCVLGKDKISFRLWADERKSKMEDLERITVAVNDPDLVKDLDKHGVNYKATAESGLGQFFMFWLPVLVLLGLLWFFIFRQMDRTGSMVMSFGKSRAKIFAERDTKTTFADVAGCDESKEELQEIIEFLKNPRKFQRLGGKIPKGVLLVGPPGTGKTLLARAVAGEAGVPFFWISGSDFVEMFVGVGAARVRDLFLQARSKAPCLVFVDEIDAVGRLRGAGLGGGHDEREQTLNALLVEMDGFDSQKGVIILAATNRPDVLDPALLRPGRFDRQVVIDAPDAKGREAILKVHLRNKPLGADVKLEVVAKRTPGFSGADLANVANEAALLAARRNKNKLEMCEFEEAIDRVIAGPERKSRAISEREKKIIAYHESGHALVAKNCPLADPLHKVSIIPRGHAALGYTLQLPVEDRYMASRSDLNDKLTVLLGGRAAEEVVLNELSTGAANDLDRATDIARAMVCQYGMSDRLGPRR